MQPGSIDKWLNKAPLWVKVLIAPIAFPVFVVIGTAIIAVLFLGNLLYLPVFLITNYLRSRRFWRLIKARGMLADWSQVQLELPKLTGTLIVDVDFHGPICTWWIHQPRAIIDPDLVFPTWFEFEKRGWDVFKLIKEDEVIKQWIADQLALYESSAKALKLSASELSRQLIEVRQETVLVLQAYAEGGLTRRYLNRFQNSQ